MVKRGSKVNLLQAFQAVSGALNQKRDDLNQMDSYNHNHGDNMVEIFSVITQAMKEKRKASPADQLAYASELLRKQQNSGSAQIYSQGLTQASEQLRDKPVNQNTAMQLIQALLGSGSSSQASQQETNPLGSLAGALLGGDSAPQSQANPMASLAGSLLGGLTGSGQSNQQSGLDIGDLLSAGMTLMQSQQGGQSSQSGQGSMEGLLNTLLTGSQMSSSSHRKESGKIVGSTLINTILPMLLKK